ncbi:MAG: HNH endonuclease [Bacteroidetes bacterium]|nr:HNH endonuclease [Bacteroidota bacterium]
MEIKLPKRYNEKANDSFRTKRNLYLFSKAVNNSWQNFGLEDFRQFEIEVELVKEYTGIYWQYEPGHEIKNGLKINEVQNQIELKEKELKDELEQFRLDYISQTFPAKYPVEQFQKLIDSEKCAYCGITIPIVNELANKQELFKKNYRGWSLEIDRKDSNLEYTPENCVMACYWCNNAKTDEFTYNEFKIVGETIRKIWENRLRKPFESYTTLTD